MAEKKSTNGGPKSKAAKRDAKANGEIALAVPLPAPTPERELFAAEVDAALRGVGSLIRRAADLGISRQGFEATGPHEDELSRDVAAGLFIAWRALQATAAFTQHGGEIWSNFRAEVHKARNVFRGGRPDTSPSADRSIAVDIARQALLYALGIGFRGHTTEDGVRLIREQFSRLYGSVFESVPDETSILAHLDGDSRAAKAMRKAWPSRADFEHKIELAAVALARDIVWAGHVAAAAGPSPGESTFRFPMDLADTTPAKLLGRLQGGQRDLKKRVRPT